MKEKFQLTEYGHREAKRLEARIVRNILKAYRKAEASGDTKRMQELERLIEVVPPEERGK